MITETFIKTELQDFNQIFNLHQDFFTGFYYRGQSDSEWNLSTSFERSCIFLESKYFGRDLKIDLEQKMINNFKAKANLYNIKSDILQENIDCLAIMQHYGAPTRLLDFSYSIFIALYFAVKDMKKDSAVWAIDKHICPESTYKEFFLSNKIDYSKNKFPFQQMADKIISNKNISFEKNIIPITPNRTNIRLSMQQGFFFMPTDLGYSFDDNLFKNKNRDFVNIDFEDLIEESAELSLFGGIKIIKIIIPFHLKSKILRYLNFMNINSEILFPGTDGFVKNLFNNSMLESGFELY